MTESKDIKQSKIEFPCENYFISVVVNTHDGFTEALEQIVTSQCRGYDSRFLKVTTSKTGKYQSYRFSITAESETQLKQLNDALRVIEHVQMVL